MFEKSGFLLLYSANAISAAGQIFVIYLLSQAGNSTAYAAISLYYFSYAVLQAFEPSIIRLFSDNATHSSSKALTQTWQCVAIGIGVILSLAISQLLNQFSMGAGGVLFCLSIGVIDYVLGVASILPIINNAAAKNYLRASKILSVQALSRFSLLSVFVFLFNDDYQWLLIVLIRRIYDFSEFGLKIVPGFFISRDSVMCISQSLAKYGFVSAILMMGAEGIGFLVGFHYGDAAYGSYRMHYDLFTKVWFFTALFPLLLYPKIKKLNSGKESEFIINLQNLSFFLSVLFLLVFSLGEQALKVTSGLLSYDRQFALVLVGVIIFGHSKIGIEFLFAKGKQRIVAGLSFLFVVIAFVSLQISSGSSYHTSSSIAWLVASIIFGLLIDWVAMSVALVELKRKLLSAILFLGTFCFLILVVKLLDGLKN